MDLHEREIDQMHKEHDEHNRRLKQKHEAMRQKSSIRVQDRVRAFIFSERKPFGSSLLSSVLVPLLAKRFLSLMAFSNSLDNAATLLPIESNLGAFNKDIFSSSAIINLACNVSPPVSDLNT